MNGMEVLVTNSDESAAVKELLSPEAKAERVEVVAVSDPRVIIDVSWCVAVS
jgi:hypothetical protein